MPEPLTLLNTWIWKFVTSYSLRPDVSVIPQRRVVVISAVDRREAQSASSSVLDCTC